MPVFNYKAIARDGSSVNGKMFAANEIDLDQKLSEQNLSLIGSKVAGGGLALLKFKPKLKDIILMCVQLEQFTKAGVPLLTALEDIRNATDSPRLKDALSNVFEAVKGGDSLSEAFRKQTGIFDDFFVGLVMVGEKTGGLADIFHKLSEHYKWTLILNSKIKKALRYPIAMLFLMAIVIGIMMVVVVPKMTDFLKNIGVDLPGYTKALIATSHFFVNNGIYVVILIVSTFFIVKFLYKKFYKVKYFLDRLMLKTPFIGQVILKINLSNFSHFFAITFTSGLEVLKCVESGRALVTNAVIREAIDKMKEKIANGISIANSMIECGVFPNLVNRMFKVGEDSGNIEESLNNITHFYDREVDASVELMVNSIQPTLIIVVGAILGWIMLAIFGPLYGNLANVLKV